MRRVQPCSTPRDARVGGKEKSRRSENGFLESDLERGAAAGGRIKTIGDGGVDEGKPKRGGENVWAMGKHKGNKRYWVKNYDKCELMEISAGKGPLEGAQAKRRKQGLVGEGKGHPVPFESKRILYSSSAKRGQTEKLREGEKGLKANRIILPKASKQKSGLRTALRLSNNDRARGWGKMVKQRGLNFTVFEPAHKRYKH